MERNIYISIGVYPPFRKDYFRFYLFSFPGLSEASRNTLTHQGGPMKEVEVVNFKTNPQFQAALRMRFWDDKAKDPQAQTPSLKEYENVCLAYLKEATKV